MLSVALNRRRTQHVVGRERRERELIADFQLPIVDLIRAAASTQTLCRQVFVMWTLTLAILTVALFQDTLHVYASAGRRWRHGAVYYLFFIMAALFSRALWADLYPGVSLNFQKQYFLIEALVFWGLSSLYRIWTTRIISPSESNKARASFLGIIIKPVVSIISFVASVLGIVSFYFQFMRR